TWAITIDNEFAGAISLDSIGSGQATIGYWMAVPFRGRGLLTEAAQAVVEFGFDSVPEGLGLVRIEWHAFAGNVASARVARRVGFHFEGTLRLGAMGRNAREDDWVAGILVGDRDKPPVWAILP
ncbi:MAG: GNAT family N-acetyltransferase, partial [Candidatus Saccharibacteria bacterium]|nr:GNAT family N-acetyltransferase [Microbacteriaceae bacterium]